MGNNQRKSRVELRNKNRRTNFILNIFIAVVFTLVLVVASQLFFGGREEKMETKNDLDQKDTLISSKENQEEDVDKQKKQADEEKEEDQVQNVEKDPFKGATISEGGAGSDVEQVFENPNWKPIGTKQTGEHYATYDKNSLDWKEMEQALSYATGIPIEDMTIRWLGNNGSPQDAKGTIESKSSGAKYRVYITWIDGQGWKPTKVEVLKR
ncbi:YrrS family protein [Aeribacillus alveayuensis]|uniref:ABC-type Na+ efflux pump permease subunit n=1 Tax=Aeribacillus alveayuensis TaxID=279215 RepID=A0ABT9VJW7_9BACI|nr:ABC-type Na+ efflux pump permease subunit [Bacillus alveayuensis]